MYVLEIRRKKNDQSNSGSPIQTFKNHKSVDKMVCSSIIEVYGKAKEIENLKKRIINEK